MKTPDDPAVESANAAEASAPPGCAPVQPDPIPREDTEEFMLFDPGEWGEPPPGESLDSALAEAAAEAEAALDARAAEARADSESEILPREEAVEIEVETQDATVHQEAEILRLRLRLRDQADTVHKLEQNLARTTEISDGLDRQVREYRTALKRLEHDVESARKRQRRDREEAERRGEEAAVRAIVEIVDNVERAAAYADGEAGQVASGLAIIREQFRSCLRRLSVERVDATAGVAFDPAVHEAVLHLPHEGLPEGRVVSEVSAGFRHRGRLLRPARVVVSAPPQPTAEAKPD